MNLSNRPTQCAACKDMYPVGELKHGMCADCLATFESKDLEDQLEELLCPAR